MGYPNSAQVDAAVKADGTAKPDVALMNALLKDFYEYLGTRAIAVDKSSATFNLAVADTHPIKILRSNSSSSVACTVLPNSSVSIAVNTVIQLCRWGTGAFTFVPGSGVTIHSAGALSLRAQYSTGYLWQAELNVWLLGGDVT